LTHSIDFNGIKDSIFLLLNLCHASESIAKSYDLTSEPGASWLDSLQYEGYLVHTSSELLVKIAINSRLWLDEFKRVEDARHEDGDDAASELDDRDIVNALEFGIQLSKNKSIGIRDTCNKIIHAESIRLILSEGQGHRDFEDANSTKVWRYWSSCLKLEGHLYNKAWEVELHVPRFCLALDHYLENLARDYDNDDGYYYDWVD